MFSVRTTSPMDDRWLERDHEIIDAAGRSSDSSSAGFSSGGEDGVRHEWLVTDFSDATVMKLRLDVVEGVRVSIREAVKGQ